MADQVELSVRSQLSKIIDELQKVKDAAKETEDSFKKISQEGSKAAEDGTKKTEKFFQNMKDFGRRSLQQLVGDFKALGAVQALAGGLSLANQFKGSIKETLSLSDAIRKLGASLGISGKDFAAFQSKMTKGLGDIGLSSEVAANALQGLSQTPVKGQENLIEYSKQAGMLASVSREQGQEGNIAKGIADVIKARGGNVNDMGQMKEVAESLRKVFVATGKGPNETLKAMEQLYTNMASDFRKTVTSAGLAKMAAAAQVAGPNATKFLEEYLSKSPIQRMALDQMGMKGVVKDDGSIDVEKLGAFSKKANEMVKGDPRLAAQMFGMSDDAAEGFIRLTQSLEQVKAAQDGVSKATGDLNQQYKSSMGFAESFKASINRVKGMFSDMTSKVTQGGSNLLSEASQSDAGAAAVVGTAAIASAVLTSGGLKGIGKTLLGQGKSELKKSAIEAMTGEKVQNVYVVNAAEIGGGGVLGDAASAPGMLGKLKTLGGTGVGALATGGLGGAATLAGGVAVAGAAGYGIGKMIEPYTSKALDKYTTKKTDEGFEGNAVERVFFKLDRLLGGKISGVSPQQWDKSQKVIVELNKKELKEAKPGGRGASY